MDSSNGIYRIDLARAWRSPPIVATTGVLGTTIGAYYATAGLVTLAFVRQLGANAQVRPILALAAIAVVVGAIAHLGRHRFPRWLYFLVVLLATSLVTLAVMFAGGGAGSMAMALFYLFVVVDSAFLFSLRGGVVQYAYAMGCASASLAHVGIPLGVNVIFNASALVIFLVIAWVSRIADAVEEDPLTGLLNRRGINRRLQDAIDRAGHDGTPLAVALLDLDKFKHINDHHSHLVGDKLLLDCAAAWRRRLPEGVHLGRYGGDEFVLVLPAHSLDDAADVTDILRLATPGATASAGVAAWTPGDSAGLLLSRVDGALYEAKSAGRNRIVVHGAPDRLTRELDNALRHGELRVHYQSVVRLDTRKVDGYEALLRWQHPRRGLIGPDEFIAHAEHSRSIHAIGRWLVEQVAADIASGRLQPAETSFNVSMHELQRADYATHLIEVMDRHGLPGRAMIVEVTESAFGDDYDPAIRRTLTKLRERGVRVAIDDFGAGHSSLRRVQSLPIDFIKLDGSLMQMIPAQGGHSPVLEALATVATRIGIGLVAEWVETEHQADVLQQLGYPMAQGWLFGKPQPLVSG